MIQLWSRLRQKSRAFRRKFWLGLYLWAGERVGPEADEFWDRHWWRVVQVRLRELRSSDLGEGTVRLLFMGNEGEAIDGQGRDYRDTQRESRSINR